VEQNALHPERACGHDVLITVINEDRLYRGDGELLQGDFIDAPVRFDNSFLGRGYNQIEQVSNATSFNQYAPERPGIRNGGHLDA